MMKNFREILIAAQQVTACKIAVAVAQDEHVIEAIAEAQKHKIAEAILIGDQEKIIEIAKRLKVDITPFEMIHQPDFKMAARQAVTLVREGKAQVVMKGLLQTADMMRAVLDKEVGLRIEGNIISHVAVIEIPGAERLVLLTDAAMNVNPDVGQKAQIIQNAVGVARSLGIQIPKVACLAAVEVVNRDMQICLDAAILSKMADRGQIRDCIVDGPLAFDNAVSVEAAAHKGIKSPVAGLADILLVPELVCGNVLYKAATLWAKGLVAGLIVGTKAPIVLTSRADSTESKLSSIALAVVASQPKK